VWLFVVNSCRFQEELTDICGSQPLEDLLSTMRCNEMLDSLEGDSISGKVITLRRKKEAGEDPIRFERKRMKPSEWLHQQHPQ